MAVSGIIVTGLGQGWEKAVGRMMNGSCILDSHLPTALSVEVEVDVDSRSKPLANAKLYAITIV